MRAERELKKAVRVSLDERLISGDAMRGRLSSVFDRAVNIAFDDLPSGLVTILRQGAPLVPDGLLVTKDDFQHISALGQGGAVEIRESQLLLGQNAVVDWDGVENETFGVPLVNPDKSVWHESRQKLERFLTENCARVGFYRMTAAAREKGMRLLEQYFLGATAGNSAAALRAAESGIGLGIGLTPSFDDALIGCMAVLRSAGLSCPLEVKAADKTTDVSRKYLLCAAEGRFSELLSEAAKAAVTGSGVEKAAAALAAVGGTSGCDMLTGIYTTLNMNEGWSTADEICR